MKQSQIINNIKQRLGIEQLNEMQQEVVDAVMVTEEKNKEE